MKQNNGKDNKKEKITKKISFIKLLEEYPESKEILFESGMHCMGCPMAMQEDLEQGAIAHGLNPDELVKKINNRLSKKE